MGTEGLDLETPGACTMSKGSKVESVGPDFGGGLHEV